MKFRFQHTIHTLLSMRSGRDRVWESCAGFGLSSSQFRAHRSHSQTVRTAHRADEKQILGGRVVVVVVVVLSVTSHFGARRPVAMLPPIFEKPFVAESRSAVDSPALHLHQAFPAFLVADRRFGEFLLRDDEGGSWGGTRGPSLFHVQSLWPVANTKGSFPIREVLLQIDMCVRITLRVRAG